MFIGHIPAGYITTRAIQKKHHVKTGLLLGLIASVLPDIDLIYFYLFDHQSTLHHSYWTHIPFYWLLILAVTVLAALIFKKLKKVGPFILIFFSNIFLHLFLDTIVGKIEWLYPFSTQSFSFFEVPAVYSWWVLNFVFHWTFLFEIGVIIWASYLLYHELLSRKNGTFNLQH